MTPIKNKLFEEFEPVNINDWEQLIIKDLNGADYDKKLISKTTEGINIKPYYSKEDLEKINFNQYLPGNFPFAAGNKTKENDYEIRQDINITDFKADSKKLAEIVSKGANSAGAIICNFDDISKNDIKEITSLINPEKTRINFFSGKFALKVLKYIIEISEEEKLNPKEVKISLNFDPLGYKTVTGGSYTQNTESDFDMMYQMFKLVQNKFPQIKIVNINGIFFRNSGSSAVQETAFILNIANEYIDAMIKRGIQAKDFSQNTMLTLGIGTNYFMEIAKIRAMRLLWSKTMEQWDNTAIENYKIFIHSKSCEWNKTIYTPFVNVLRATTETMSAVIGGTDSVSASTHDFMYKQTDEFSERIARNIPIILKEESILDKSVDPSAGAYFIESLTNSIAENALELFLKIEKEGGYFSSLKNEIIQTKINETCIERNNYIATRKEILLGTNQYPKADEKALQTIETQVYERKIPQAENPEVKTLKFYRGAEAFEKLRLETEKASKTPKVLLLTYGNLTMRKARASFATSFFACAGYEIIENSEFTDIKKAAEKACTQKADITVICSSDEEYPEIIKEIFDILNKKTLITIAGAENKYFEEAEKQNNLNFINIKSNVLKELTTYQTKLNVNN